ncbi:ribosome recycling factor [Thermoanaerobacterium thermosaccharolyticum]|jgi:ribosome recycling factor|uniref:Ribosome-recycling factor n=3 Tax=Thermoanaerobacterium thermosaccharolyticum TaxID=1517 RepID=D9TM92_THETC|nr:ribosome recycling factor [Thermoanaerobacterium thermosaccharolyticum]TCW38659.1 ribosome recycling factor [Thermohydrogenium kirishiense]ADL68936.1 ribosome recycling factor [Thermoanaerobacterium thermosaccharolyticum DSM 571]AGB19029.1 ribosome recycling factor [Thermoanaerobacterium thermosaccharolyticum M0795]AST59022.1 ribosome recycling factor [Thermoanaerobacterium thermosaccharolyticum]KAA5807744.1 ribosome recycling factor [Thermoanaerobacterium thermosaccharolyticum]
MDDLLKNTEEKMKKSIAVLKNELMSIRAGRANPALLDRISIDYYGTMTPINKLATITAPEPKVIIIQPWDTSKISEIEKAIQKSDLNINPTSDGKIIRLVFPDLTEERRKELVKLVHKKGEEARVAVRQIRRDANDIIKKMDKNGEISEDEKLKSEESVQKLTDKYIKEIDKILEQKEKEIMEF